MKRSKYLLLLLCSLLYIPAFAQFNDLIMSTSKGFSCSDVPDLCQYYISSAGYVTTDNNGHAIDMLYFDLTAQLRTIPLSDNSFTVNDYRKKFADYPFAHRTVKIEDRLYYLFAECSKTECKIWAYEIDNVTGVCREEGHEILTTGNLVGYATGKHSAFEVGYSADKSKLVIYYHTAGADHIAKMDDGDHPEASYVIVDKNMRKLASGSGICPFAVYKYEVLNVGMDSKNNVYALYKTKDNDKRYEVVQLRDKGTEAKKCHLDIEGDEGMQTHFVLDQAMTMKFVESQDGNMRLYGCSYKQENSERSSDLYIFRLDMTEGKALRIAKTHVPFYTGMEDTFKAYFKGVITEGTFYRLHIEKVMDMPDKTQIIMGTADMGFFMMRIDQNGNIKWFSHTFSATAPQRINPIDYILTDDGVYILHTSTENMGKVAKSVTKSKFKDLILSKFTFDGKVEEKKLKETTEIMTINSSPDHKKLLALTNTYGDHGFDLLKISLNK